MSLFVSAFNVLVLFYMVWSMFSLFKELDELALMRHFMPAIFCELLIFTFASVFLNETLSKYDSLIYLLQVGFLSLLRSTVGEFSKRGLQPLLQKR